MQSVNKERLNDFWKKKLQFIAGDRALEDYIQSEERAAKKELGFLFYQLQIRASVKLQPYSLPYQKEIIKKMYIESYVNAAMEYQHSFKPIVKQLIDDDVTKIRFYFYIESANLKPLKTNLKITMVNDKIKVNGLPDNFELPHLIYRFRYRVDK